jgi:hypothetical protein
MRNKCIAGSCPLSKRRITLLGGIYCGEAILRAGWNFVKAWLAEAAISLCCGSENA